MDNNIYTYQTKTNKWKKIINLLTFIKTKKKYSTKVEQNILPLIIYP